MKHERSEVRNPWIKWHHESSPVRATEQKAHHNHSGLLCLLWLKLLRHSRVALLRNGFRNPRHYRQRAEMVRIVIGYQERFAQDGLAVAVS